MFCDVGNYGYNEQKAEFAMNTSYCTVKVSATPIGKKQQKDRDKT